MQVAVQLAPGLFQQELLKYSFNFGGQVLMVVLANAVVWVFQAEMQRMHQ
jgi:hypothetical protein